MRVKIPPKLSAKQQNAMDREMYRQIAENVRNLTSNIIALVLWQLHEQEGFGKKKLLRFHKDFLPALKELQDYYEMHTADETEWVCKYKLKQMGIDVDNMEDILKLQIAYKN